MDRKRFSAADERFMRQALSLAQRGFGKTSPNPMVGALLVRKGEVIGRGWHRAAGRPHAEIEAIADARKNGHVVRGATLYVTLEPCCTHGRTPPCTTALIRANLGSVIAAAADPNPAHAGRAFALLAEAGIKVAVGLLKDESLRLNEAFNHWIVHKTPWVTVKSAMTLDGKIATRTGESKWITSAAARRFGMTLRQGSDAILIGIGTVLRDDPSLTRRVPPTRSGRLVAGPDAAPEKAGLRRVVLDTQARTPLTAQVVSDAQRHLTTIVVGRGASSRRVRALRRQVAVVEAPVVRGQINVSWLLKHLGREGVTGLLVEGGSAVVTAFLSQGLAQKLVFFYAPKIIGGRDAVKATAGRGVVGLASAVRLEDLRWCCAGPDLVLQALINTSSGWKRGAAAVHN